MSQLEYNIEEYCFRGIVYIPRTASGNCLFRRLQSCFEFWADLKSKAEKVFVPYGELDEYYMMASGGHSGQLFVYGLPSMRKIRTVPVFTPDPATGYGYDAKSKEMLGGFTWGDFHHPAISETSGDYDGQFLFANDVGNNRVAAVDLSTFPYG